MTEHDFFNLLTNIDDKLIANAKSATGAPYDPFSDLPQKISPQRRSPWKSIAAAAACLTVAVVGIAVLCTVIANKKAFVSPNSSMSGYPADAKYQYIGDFSDLELNSLGIASRARSYTFEDLAEKSSAVVVGTFVDDARQNVPLTGMIKYSEMESYNKLCIDKVFKGEVKVGEEIVISDNYCVNEGKLFFMGSLALTPMIKGEQWVYFLDKSGDGDYYDCLGCTDGRYPVPGSEKTFVLTGDYRGVFDESGFNSGAYEDVKKMLGCFDGVEKVDFKLSKESNHEFTMPEFFGETFVIRQSALYVVQNKRSETARVLYAAPGILSMYLADLNGDGKRELISECWNGLSGLSATYISVYDHANSKLYGHYVDNSDKYGMLTSELKLKDNVLYVETYELGSYDNPVLSEPLTFDKLTEIMEGEPEPEQVVYDGKTYNIVRTLIWDDEVFLSVGLTQYEYEVGSCVEVLAMVYNYTDKPMGLLMPVQGEGSHTEVGVTLEHGNTQLYDVSVTGCFNEAMGSHIIQPGETYYQVMRFDTLAERYAPESTIIPRYVPIGNYEGRACISVLDVPNDTSSETTHHELKFDVNVVQRQKISWDSPKEFTMDEFPGTVFFCDGERLRAETDGKSTDLYAGMPIDDLYLIDLNGDGKRELCSTAYFGSGIVDMRINAYDFANGKLYELSDRGYYDYRIRVYGGFSDDDWYAEAVKYRYNSSEEIFSERLTLDIMTEAGEQTADIREPKTGVEEVINEPNGIKSEITFVMEEFPNETFCCNSNSITVKRADGTVTELYKNETIKSVYLYDLNNDGRREIVVEGITIPLAGSVGMKTPDPVEMITAIDHLNHDYGINMFSDKAKDYSLVNDGNALYIAVNGEKESEPITFEQMTRLEKGDFS